MNNRTATILFLLVTTALATTSGCWADKQKEPAKTADTSRPALSQRAMLFPHIEFQTSHGNFTVELHGRRAPHTVRNFVQYVVDGHYDGTIFHRVIPGFMAQAGGYDADMAEKPLREPVVNESGNGFQNVRGTIAMARTNDPHSATAQFYINLVDNPALDPNPKRWGYTVFGEVTAGIEVLDKIATIPTGAKGEFARDVPVEVVTIKKATITNK